jgi:hypothetical protein
MPCLRARVLSRRCSRAASVASMSVSTAAMAVYSGRGGSETSMFSIVLAFKLGTPEASL